MKQSIISNYLISGIVAVLLFHPLYPNNFTEQKKSPYEEYLESRNNKWSKLMPNTYSVQFAGDIGMLSSGLGWQYGKKQNWDTFILVGYIPKGDMEHSYPTFTLKEHYTPWRINLNRSFDFEPLICSLFANTIFGEEFWTREPDRYPKDYYGFSTKIRFHIGVGQSVSYTIKPEKRRRAKQISFYYEISSCDLYIISSIDKYIHLSDILSLGIGIKYTL